eukprot:c11280_g1_i2 orf=250-450(-)
MRTPTNKYHNGSTTSMCFLHDANYRGGNLTSNLPLTTHLHWDEHSTLLRTNRVIISIGRTHTGNQR